MELLKDKFGRKFPYIRLSITDVCNFKCGYCLPNGFKIDKSDNRTFLSLEEIKRLAKGLSELGVSKIRLTGGEPTIRKDFYEIVKVIKNSSGINKTVITTNGYKLDKFAEQLVESGLDGINISIDSLDKNKFHKITGHDRLNEILNGIEKLQKGLTQKVLEHSVREKESNLRILEKEKDLLNHMISTLQVTNKKYFAQSEQEIALEKAKCARLEEDIKEKKAGFS